MFFIGIPGCGKSALCKEIVSSSGGLKDGRPVHSLMGDLTKGVCFFPVKRQLVCMQWISWLEVYCGCYHFFVGVVSLIANG